MNIIQWVEDQNRKSNRYYPIFGICQGFQQIIQKYSYLLTPAEGYRDGAQWPFEVNQENFKNSKLFGQFNQKKTQKFLRNKNNRFYNKFGQTVANYKKNQSGNIIVIATASSTFDKKNEIVTMFEHKDLPFYGIQPHPEQITEKKINRTPKEQAPDSERATPGDLARYRFEILMNFKNLIEANRSGPQKLFPKEFYEYLGENNDLKVIRIKGVYYPHIYLLKRKNSIDEKTGY